MDKALVKNEHYAISLFGIPYRGCKRDAPKHISSIRSLSAPLYLPQYWNRSRILARAPGDKRGRVYIRTFSSTLATLKRVSKRVPI